MKRFFSKIFHFFWSWGFLKFVLAVIALVVLLYIEEDWRGAHNWAATKAKWEAQGETFDYSKFTPPPVPDDQNLAALPLFKLEPVEYSSDSSTTYPGTPTLNRAMRDDLPSAEFQFPQTPNWMKGELPDMAAIKKTLAANYALACKGTALPDDPLAQFNAIYPFFADFVAAAATHPVFRINLDYSVSPPALRSLGPITAPIKLAKILTLHGILALDQKRPDLALQDLKVIYELVSGVKRDPSLVGGLVAIGSAAIGNGILYDGLAQHEWTDAQLSEIEQMLKSMNYLVDYQFAMRCEAAQSVANLESFEKHSQRDHRIFEGLDSRVPIMSRFAPRWPSGWWDGNKSRMAAFVFQSLASVDPQAHLVFPQAATNLQNQIERANASWDAYAPWNIFADMAAGTITSSTHQFSQAQVWVDEARIACALERYRNAQGVYPASLDALAPAYIDALPHDIMNGQPYHYQLRPDGTYLLYSVGWNQTDDGGKVGYMRDAPKQLDYTQGDWVWPTPQYASAQSAR